LNPRVVQTLATAVFLSIEIFAIERRVDHAAACASEAPRAAGDVVVSSPL